MLDKKKEVLNKFLLNLIFNRKEAEYADNALSRNRLIPIIVEREYRPKSWIGIKIFHKT